jgi:nucleotidyltransferase/DNA polymerase involved in DNA repair
MATISDIDGIGPILEEKLKLAGIRSVNQLLEKCGTQQGRKQTAEKTGIEESTLLKWANMADLYRIKGIGCEYSQLLERAGVDTVKELRNRVPVNLLEKMIEINRAKRLVRRIPPLRKVEEFVGYAKTLEPKISY